MSVTVTSTTDSNEAVTAAMGDLAVGKIVEDKKESAAPPKEAAEKPEESDASDENALEENKERAEDSDDSSVEDQKDPKPKKSGFKKRIDKLTSRLSQKEQEIEYWKAEALKQKPQFDEPKPVEKKAEPDDRPNPDNFDTNEAYVEALADWKVERKLSEREAKQKEVEVKSEVQKQVDRHVERVQEFKKSHTDFDEMMEEVDGIPMSLTVQQVVLDSENGAELMYELAKNPEEYARICKLPAIQAARELGKFESKIKQESSSGSVQPKKTKAPPPINPVGTKSTGGFTKAPDEMDFQEFKKWRQAQLR